MPNQTWRSSGGSKKPPQQREPQKEAKKKSLEDACKDIKKNLADLEREKKAAVLREKHRVEEDAQMAEVYGPNWKKQLPEWAEQDNRSLSDQNTDEDPDEDDEDLPLPEEEDEDEDDPESNRVIPFPRRTDKRRKVS